MKNLKSGLIIDEPWIDLILKGEKIWEVRGTNSKKRERIFLIKKGTKSIVGEADLVDSRLLDLDDFIKGYDYHKIPINGRRLPYKNTWAWTLTNVKIYEIPTLYSHPNGAVIWVNFNR